MTLNLDGIDLSFLDSTKSQQQTSTNHNNDVVSLRSPYYDSISKWATEYGVDTDYLSGSLAQESRFNPNAESQTGVTNIAQVTGSTAKQIAIELGDELANLSTRELRETLVNNPDKAIQYSAYYKKKMLDLFDNDERKAIAAYNAGPGAVQKASTMYGDKWLENIDKIVGEEKGKEVKNHVPKVMGYKDLFKSSTNINFDGVDLSFLNSQTQQLNTQPTISQSTQEDTKIPHSNPWIGAASEGTKDLIRNILGMFRGERAASEQTYGKASKNTAEEVKSLSKIQKALENNSGKEGQIALPAIYSKDITGEDIERISSILGKTDLSTITLEEVTNALNQAKSNELEYGYRSRLADEEKKVYEKTQDKLAPKQQYQDLDGVAGFVQDIVRGAPNMAASIGAYILNPALGTAYSGASMAGGQMNQLLDEGADPEATLKYSIYAALPNMALDKLGLEKVSKVIKGTGVGSKIGRQFIDAGLVEGITEALQAYPTALADIWAKSEGKSDKEKVDNFVKNIGDITKGALYEGLVGGTLGLLGAGGGKVISSTANKIANRGDVSNDQQDTQPSPDQTQDTEQPLPTAEQSGPELDLTEISNQSEEVRRRVESGEAGTYIDGLDDTDTNVINRYRDAIGGGRRFLHNQVEALPDSPEKANILAQFESIDNGGLITEQPAQEVANDGGGAVTEPNAALQTNETEQNVVQQPTTEEHILSIAGVGSLDEVTSLPIEEQDRITKTLLEESKEPNSVVANRAADAIGLLDRLYNETAPEAIREALINEDPHVGKEVFYKGEPKKFKGKDVTKERSGTIVDVSPDGKIASVERADGRVEKVPLDRIINIDGVVGVPNKLVGSDKKETKQTEKPETKTVPVKDNKKEEIKPIQPTKKDSRKGKTIASEIKGLKFVGVEQGLQQGKETAPPSLVFDHYGTKIVVPNNTNTDAVKNAIVNKYKTMDKSPEVQTISDDLELKRMEALDAIDNKPEPQSQTIEITQEDTKQLLDQQNKTKQSAKGPTSSDSLKPENDTKQRNAKQQQIPEDIAKHQGVALSRNIENVKFDKVVTDKNGNQSLVYNVKTGKDTSFSVSVPANSKRTDLIAAIAERRADAANDKSEDTIKGKKEKAQERVAKTGTDETERYVRSRAEINKLANGDEVEYDPNNHRLPVKKGGLFKSISFNDDGNVNKYEFYNDTLQRNAEVVNKDGKVIIKAKDDFMGGKYKNVFISPREKLKPLTIRKKNSTVKLDENIKVDNEEEISTELAAQEDVEERQAEYKGLKLGDDPRENFNIAKSALEGMRKKIGEDAYKDRLKALEEYYDEYVVDDSDEVETARYAKMSDDKDFNDRLDAIINGFDEVKGTEDDNIRGKKLASKVKDIRFDGVYPGYNIDGKIIPPKLQFSDLKTETTFSIPINSKIKDLTKRLEEKRADFLEPEVNKVTVELFKVLKNIKKRPEFVIGTSVKNEKTGKTKRMIGKRDYGAIKKMKDGRTIIFINPNIDKQDVLPTIIHELFGHLGATEVLSYDADLYKYTKALFDREVLNNSESINKIAKTYKTDKTTDNKKLFDEWIAFNIEEAAKRYFKDGKFQESVYKNDETVVKKIFNVIKRLIGRVSDLWYKTPVTPQERTDMAIAIMQKFGDIKSGDYNGETRFAKELDTEDKPKTKRTPPKQKTRSEKMATYAEDKVKLITGSVKGYKIRFYDFVNKYLYGDNLSSAKSYRDQILDLISESKVKGDDKFNEAINVMEELVGFNDINKEMVKVKAFERRFKSVVGNKKNPNITEIKSLLNGINDKYKDVEIYQTMRRIDQRGSVPRPFKKGTNELTTMGKKYEELNKLGYLENTFNDTEKPRYELNKEGKAALELMRKDYTESNFGAVDIENDLNTIKTLYKDNSENISGIKNTKKEAVKSDIESAVEQIKKEPVEFKNIILRGGDKLYRVVLGNDLARSGKLLIGDFSHVAGLIDGFKGGAFTKVAKILKKGRDSENRFHIEQNNFLKEGYTKLGIDPMELYTYTDASIHGMVARIKKLTGKLGNIERFKKVKYIPWKVGNSTVDLTRSRRIAIYMYSKNQEALAHLTSPDGGFKLLDKKDVYKPSMDDIAKLNSSLTPKEKALGDLLFKYFENQGKKINEISMDDIGYELAGVSNYLPILVDGTDIIREIDDRTSLDEARKFIGGSTPGALKSRTNSTKPIVLEGAFESLARTSSMVEKYIGMAIPLKHAERFLEGVKKDMIDNGLKPEYESLKFHLETLTQPARRSRVDKAFFALDKYWIPAALGGKVLTPLIQLTSTVGYLAETPDSVNKSKIVTNIPKISKQIKQYNESKTTDKSPTKISKLIEIYAPSLSRRLAKRTETSLFERGVNAAVREKFGIEKTGLDEKIISNEFLMGMIGNSEKLTATMYWKMASSEVALTYPDLKPGSKEFYEKVGGLVTERAENTQAFYDTLGRAEVLKYPILKRITYFMNQPLKELQLLQKYKYRIVEGLKTGDEKKVVNALIGGLIFTVVIPTAIAGLRYMGSAARGKEEDDDTSIPIKIAKGAYRENVSRAPYIGNFLAAPFEDYKFKSGGTYGELETQINNLIRETTAPVRGEEIDQEKLLKILDKTSSMFVGGKQAFDQYKQMIESLQNN